MRICSLYGAGFFYIPGGSVMAALQIKNLPTGPGDDIVSRLPLSQGCHHGEQEIFYEVIGFRERLNRLFSVFLNALATNPT